jgi:cell division protein FtsL
MTPAPARSHRRRTGAALAPRRVSGPVRRVAPAGASLPRRGTTGIFARVRALPEHRVVDRLLRSRLWIWALGALLGGIVTMQVSLLKLNSGISRAVETTTTLERQNAELEMAIARLSSPARVDDGAQALGMVLPAAGQVGYLTPGPRDAERAVRRMQPPSEEAAALLANNGVEPGSLAAPVAPVDGTAAVEPTDPTITPDPAATAPDPTATTEPAPVATAVPPVQETPPATTEASPAGGAVAGQG